MVVNFPNYRPPARYDDVAFVTARIQQSATEGGSYTLTEDITLDPVDTDPGNPQVRDFTTTLGTDDLWYRIVWVDADNVESAPTIPGQNTNGTVPGGVTAWVTAAELAAILKVNPSTQATALEQVINAAAGEIVQETGRTDFSGWEVDLAAQVNLERAVEHWHARPVGFAIVGLDTEAPVRLASNPWERHANKLAPLKDGTMWGFS